MIAQRDLEIRGPGEVLGTRQTGLPQFRVADLLTDQDLLPAVTKAAETLITQHPENVAPLINRWFGTKLNFGQV